MTEKELPNEPTYKKYEYEFDNGRTYELAEVGRDGTLIFRDAVFKATFDDGGRNDWEKSSGKKLLEQWFKEYAPTELQERFDIDLPTVEEVFSQKMINWWGGYSIKGLVSKQFPIFKDSDERMKEFDGESVRWWTRSPFTDGLDDPVWNNTAWNVTPEGNIDINGVYCNLWFVPVLRKKK